MRLRGQLGIARRGELSTQQLIALIIILVTAVVVILLIIKVRDVLRGEAEGECAAAVAQANFANRLYGREFGVAPKGCDTQHVTVKAENLAGSDALKRRQVERIVAEQMRTCWRTWGSGKFDLYNGTGDYCHTCALIDFEPGVQELFSSSNGNIEQFTRYLANTTSPEGLNYSDVLTGFATPTSGVEGRELSYAPFSIDTSKQYAVVFWYSREKGATSLLERWTGWDVTPTQVGMISSGLATALEFTIGGAIPGRVLRFAGISTVAQIGAGGVALAGIAGYAYARSNEDWSILSATYILPNDAASYYGQQCSYAGATPTSP